MMSESIPQDHPRYLAMRGVIESPSGKEIAIAAAKDGVPPLCALDELLRSIIKDYKPNYNTADAGAIIANMMRNLGYEEAGKKSCSAPGSVAQSGLLWKPKPNG